MKKIFKYSLLMLSVVAAFVACKDEDKTAPGEWDANPNYANVYFENTTQQVELDPTAATTATIAIYRRDTIGARTVKMDVVENTDGVFTVGDAVFADGDSVAYITVDFPKAEVGKTYTLTLTSSDPDLVSSYSQNASYTLNVTRIKWNLVGKATLTEKFIFGGSGTFDLYVRDDDPTKFRFDDMFEDIAVNTETALDGNQTKQAFVSILKKGDVLGGVTVTQSDLIGFEEDLNSGFLHPTYGADILICHPYGFSSTKEEKNWSHNTVLGYQDNGLPTQIQIAPFYYTNGVGGWNYSQQDGYVIITFPGYEPVVTYEAYFDPFDEEGDDFQWSPVKTFDFTNSVTGEVRSNVMLQRATCTVATDECDSVFMAQYGVPYRLIGPFEDGYDIYFFVKSGKVTIPADFADYFELQETGMVSSPLNTPLYAAINTDKSSFTTVEVADSIDIKEINLNMSFYDKKAETTFGTADMVLNNVTWTKVATGTYYYVMFSGNEDGSPEADPGYELYKRDDKDNIFKIADWLMGTDFMFTWDQATNACVVLEQDIDYEHPSYGPMYIIEGALYNPDRYGENTSYYDPETKIFHFFPAYCVSAGSFGQVEEFFEITEEAAAKRQAPLKFGNAKLNTSIKKHSPWKAKKLAQPYSSKPAFQRFTR